jgi:hypothetical protein
MEPYKETRIMHIRRSIVDGCVLCPKPAIGQNGKIYIYCSEKCKKDICNILNNGVDIVVVGEGTVVICTVCGMPTLWKRGRRRYSCSDSCRQMRHRQQEEFDVKEGELLRIEQLRTLWKTYPHVARVFLESVLATWGMEAAELATEFCEQIRSCSHPW